MNRIRVDDSEVLALAADVGRISGRAVDDAAAIVEKGALNIKNGLRDAAQGHPSFPAFPNSISYDINYGAGSIEAEIGPDKNRTQGALGNLLYFGSSKNAPVLDLEGPVRSEEPKFDRAITDMVDGFLGG
ncbi:hypothetical protein CLV30_12579 [Haloactinopolyspora alba]|uniref:HK97 gp10 family phage protein n=1 Tax=Haloactinopolyspora alba TaxID=648780 RepID=A0A2P8DHJ1_9ACTN|nr:hypothetical protein [Haloactinopolyspora alba]PSK96697.1 hypothetical protein CLV30_12579 [Haloactinopolyspora alba]